jgi:hypothetical protein
MISASILMICERLIFVARHIVFTTVPWNARGTPVFVRETSSSKRAHVLAFGNFDINDY